MKKQKIFQIRSRQDASIFARKIRKLDLEFYYHVPLVGGMEGSFVTIHCDPKSTKCEIYSSIPGCRNEEIKRITELEDHIWNDRKFINAELRKKESEWYRLFEVSC